jgi:hypothetical protein
MHSPRDRDRIMSFLERNYLPDFSKHIVAEHVIDPLHFHNTLNSYRGAAFSLQPNLFQSAWFRPYNKAEDSNGHARRRRPRRRRARADNIIGCHPRGARRVVHRVVMSFTLSCTFDANAAGAERRIQVLVVNEDRGPRSAGVLGSLQAKDGLALETALGGANLTRAAAEAAVRDRVRGDHVSGRFQRGACSTSVGDAATRDAGRAAE